MGRSRYLITEADKPHFLTCTVLEWLPLFTRPALVDILLDSWRYQQAQNGLRLYGYVILENHLHFVAQAPNLGECVRAIAYADVVNLAKNPLTFNRLRQGVVNPKQIRSTFDFCRE